MPHVQTAISPHEFIPLSLMLSPTWFFKSQAQSQLVCSSWKHQH